MASPYTMIGADGREYSGSLEELRQWAQDGRLGPSTLVWSAVDERWIEASGRHELAWDLPSPPPPAPSGMRGSPRGCATRVSFPGCWPAWPTG